MLTVKCPACKAEFPSDIQIPLSALNENQVYGNMQDCPVCGNAVQLSSTTLVEN